MKSKNASAGFTVVLTADLPPPPLWSLLVEAVNHWLIAAKGEEQKITKISLEDSGEHRRSSRSAALL